MGTFPDDPTNRPILRGLQSGAVTAAAAETKQVYVCMLELLILLLFLIFFK
jgi:hypothetical protein